MSISSSSDRKRNCIATKAKRLLKTTRNSEPLSTYYRWRKEYGGTNTSDVRRMKGLEKENTRLKKLVAKKVLDISILGDVSSKNF